MALDGAFLSVIKNEIESVAIGARIDKIHQPSREELMIVLRWRGGTGKLLLSAGANSPRIHFTKVALENPKSPPMFCMLARKYLGSGKLLAVRQIGLDRVLALDFETMNELGDYVVVSVVIEIMGRHSNIILVDQTDRVIDSIKRVNDDMSRVRCILPGITYVLPPLQHKLNLKTDELEQIIDRMTASTERKQELSKAMLATLEGFSPLLCRELANYVGRSQEVVADELTDDQKNRLRFQLNKVRDILLNGGAEPTMLIDKQNKPSDFCFLDILQYGSLMLTKPFETVSDLLDSFYSERDRLERMKQRSHDLLKMLVNTTERISRKLDSQRVELSACGERELFKMKADLLSANFYLFEKGETSVVVQNFYDENGGEIKIDLDPMLMPPQNAQKYYSEYRKAATAERMLIELIAKSEEELIYIDSVFDAVSRTVGDSELLEIREELAEQGYIKKYKLKNNRMLKALPPLCYRSTDGFTILCGRNNKQNDKLTLKTAKNHDIWFHTQNIPGSHVVVVTDGETPPDSTLEQALHIAAYHSKARGSAQVPVDYTEIRYVKKPAGGKPGMVIFENNKTAFVAPDEVLVNRLLGD